MSWATNGIIEVLIFLLPGFVATAVFYWLTSHLKPDHFSQVMHALAFTMVVQTIAGMLVLLGALDLFAWTQTTQGDMLVRLLIGIVVGAITVWNSNRDVLHGVLRRIGITRETSYPSELYSAFEHHPDCYVVLHLTGERRLYGWPEEWPRRLDRGHYRLLEGEWLTEGQEVRVSSSRQTNGEETSVVAYVVPADQVEMIEFVQAQQIKESME